MKTFINLVVIYTIIILVHLLLLKIKEIELMKTKMKKIVVSKTVEPVYETQKSFNDTIQENFDEYDETSMKKDLLSFINNPQPSMLNIDQQQSIDDIYRNPELSDEVLERNVPEITDNRILSIDTLNYEDDKQMNTGIIENGLMAFDYMDMGLSSF
jgi:hypothetical protein